MINRMVPMISPFSLYVRRREQLWMLKKTVLAALASVYHQASQVIVALRQASQIGISGLPIGRSNCIGGLENMEAGTGKQKAPSLFGLWTEQEGARREMVLTLGS
jgi:hypothetical protein